MAQKELADAEITKASFLGKQDLRAHRRPFTPPLVLRLCSIQKAPVGVDKGVESATS